ncbi:k+dependent na+ exchanger related-protein [Halogranum salarium B-1]|uniref:K+dependent na+ exchanger related-protein n=2 Tax=Halogranum rubrum TaxID=553466 RepID=J3A6Z5_9EURY|nr:k+dependent na+ exchanger related-protein [Halogranum salarium B-1]
MFRYGDLLGHMLPLGTVPVLQADTGASLSEVLLSTNSLYLLAGILLLYLGAEFLVDGAARLALGFGLKAAIVGVTIVAFATTTPELFVAILSGLDHSSSLGLGAIVGSNIANIGLVLGIAALIRPLSVDESVFREHVPFMVAAAVVLVGLGLDGRLGRFDGGVFLLLLAAFTAYLFHRMRQSDDPVESDEVDLDEDVDPELADVLKLAGGLVLLLLGSRWLIQGGQGALVELGFGPRFVGLTVLAFGTSLPELAASVVSAMRGESEFSIGNVVGSNIYNILAVLGVLALMVPLEVPVETITFDFPVLIGFTFGAIALMFRNKDVSRFDGGVLVSSYLVFFYFLLP